MNILKTRPATLVIIVVNVLAFLFTFIKAGTLDNPAWTFTLFDIGALFNPLTLDREWYRIITHMFLHGSLLHIAFNMYALYAVGGQIEELTGTKKFLWVYFLSGLGSALASLYWSMFTIGVGASGAIFGLFGYDLIINLVFSRKQGISIVPLVVNFSVFLLINVLLGEAFHADHAAHLGGLATGSLLAAATYYRTGNFIQVKMEYVFIPLLVIIFFLLPRYQVNYYNFYQEVLKAEDNYKELSSKPGLTDNQYADLFQENNKYWDSAGYALKFVKDIPEKLKNDSSRLARYVSLRKLENTYKTRMIRDELYILMDSVDAVQDSMANFLQLDFPLSFRMTVDPPDTTQTAGPQPEMSRVWYDSNWVETDGPSTYYRLGFKDSLGRWDGPVRDHYANGKIQMKGVYKKDKRDGIFLYYSDHDTYTSAGRYVDNRSYGKWQNFHDNGKLESETIFLDRTFLKTLYDSNGNQLVQNGNGKIEEFYPDGSIKTQGQYFDGWKEGTWIGKHPDGSMHYMEEFHNGVLIRGRSQTLKGERFIYDGSSLQALPEGGYPNFKLYLQNQIATMDLSQKGTVKLSFRVTKSGIITDFEFEQQPDPVLIEKAKQLILEGPSWIPAKLHGHEATDGFAWVEMEF